MTPDPLADRQRGIVMLGSGQRPIAVAGIDVTSGGLLAIGALVSSILLSTAVLVGVAVRESRRGPRPRAAPPPGARRRG